MKQRKRIFVGCEGASERSYIRWLQHIADTNKKAVYFDTAIAGGGDPLAVVEQSAKALAAQERKKGKYAFRAVLFDIDRVGQSPERDAKISGLAIKHRLTLLRQEWDHEAILLRHFPGCDVLRPPPQSSLIELRRRWPDYAKPEDAQSLRLKLDVAGLKRMLKVEGDFDRFLRPLVV